MKSAQTSQMAAVEAIKALETELTDAIAKYGVENVDIDITENVVFGLCRKDDGFFKVTSEYAVELFTCEELNNLLDRTGIFPEELL